ncbi:MAG: shikimate dehydrogenase, partial [Clostridia bacterium]|nr:shikimate dehydrogenase [Clostridia bacterium]
MKYGLIGGKLGHSFSKEIHARLADYEYELKELPPEGVDELMTSKDFCAVNVTIPYKERVLPFMEQIDEGARRIGSVNTVVNRDGRLCGYNTDYMGMRSLILRHCGGLDGKTVLILGGDGGTARTAYAVATDLGAKAVYRVSRSAKDGFIDYPTALTVDADVIINTTPVGMFPDTDGMPIDVKAFPHLSLVIDAVYNPLRTPLVLAAQEMGIPAEGGLYMLVSQAVYACTHFTGREFGEETFRTVFAKTRSEKENIVLTGMPGC